MTQWRAKHCLLKQKGLRGRLFGIVCIQKGWYSWSSGSLSVPSESHLSGPVSRLTFLDTSMNQPRSSHRASASSHRCEKPQQELGGLGNTHRAALQSHLWARPCVSFTAESRKPAISYYNIILYLFSKLFFMCHLFP